MGESYVTTGVVDSGTTGANAPNSFSPSATMSMVQSPSASVVIIDSSSVVGQGNAASTTERGLKTWRAY